MFQKKQFIDTDSNSVRFRREPLALAFQNGDPVIAVQYLGLPLS